MEYKTSVFYAGGGSEYTFPFEYLQKSFVKVRYQKPDGAFQNLEFGKDYNVEENRVTLTTASDSADKVNIYRSTPTDRMVKYVDASILKAHDMNVNELQTLHIMEEQTDYLSAYALFRGDNANVWEANTLRIINLATPLEPTDAVNKAYVDEYGVSWNQNVAQMEQQLKNQAQAVKASAAAALASQNAAKTSETNAAASKSAAADSASAAKKWAMSPVSPDGVVDTDSPTGYTQSAKIWAESAKRSSDKASASARQQQSDWDVEDDSVTSYIKNKPVLGYYIDTKYGLTNDNFTEKFSDFLAKAVENDKIALLTQTYTVNDAITIRADKVMLDSINGKLIGSGSIDFRAVKELYCRNIRYSITMKFNYRGDEEYKQKDRKIWIENCDAFGGSVQENFGLYISTPEPANGYSDRNQRDYTKYGIFLDNYSGYNALMIVNKSIDDTGATIKGGVDNSALGITDRVTGVVSPAVLIDTTRNPFRVISPDAPPNDTIHQVAFDMGNTGNISIGCSTLNADSSFNGSYNIKIFSDFPTIAMKSGKYNVQAMMYIDKYLGFTVNGATVLKLSSSSVTSIRNGNDIQLRLEGRNGNAVGLLVDDDGNLRISKYATVSQDKDQPRLLYAGAVSSRPTLTHYAGDVGCMVFDKNLGKPIWWTGKNWVDATGTAV